MKHLKTDGTLEITDCGLVKAAKGHADFYASISKGVVDSAGQNVVKTLGLGPLRRSIVGKSRS